MADLDDEPAKFSELDLSEDTAIDGEDVEEALGGGENASVVRADDDPDTDDAEE